MIYLNNAGTTWPKPESVNEAMSNISALTPDDWTTIYEKGLETVVGHFNIPSANRFLFTTSCTSSLGIAFSDFSWEEGDRLVISAMEHHALSRWFYKLQRERNVEGVIIPRATGGPFDLEKLEAELKKGVRLVAVSMASNVTGEILPYERIIDLAHSYGALCLLDGAQTAGIFPIDIAALKPDFFVFAGHKAPFGPQGIGGLYIDNSISMVCPSATCEIVIGDRSSKGVFPSYCDTGSVNMMALAGLTAGLNWLEEQSWNTLINKRKQLAKLMRDGLGKIPGLTILGTGDENFSTGAVSVTVDGYKSQELGDILWQKHAIKASAGFQCAPLAHEALGTDESGTLRFSVGPMNTEKDIEVLLVALSGLV